MKKQDLATLAMIGISAGLLIGGCQQNQKNNRNSNGNGNMTERMTPDMQSFYNSLSPEAQKKFVDLDAQHKMMAMEMANQSCNGKNACKGMGGCATAKNSCAGKNDCKGQGGTPVKNSDDAVHVQHKHQMDQGNNNSMKNNRKNDSKKNGQSNNSMMNNHNNDSNSCAGPGGCGNMQDNDDMNEGHAMPKGRTHSY